MILLHKEPLSNKIFGTLRDKIVFLEYPPGRNLSGKDLCKAFRVSRAPLRDAMRRLPGYHGYPPSVPAGSVGAAF